MRPRSAQHRRTHFVFHPFPPFSPCSHLFGGQSENVGYLRARLFSGRTLPASPTRIGVFHGGPVSKKSRNSSGGKATVTTWRYRPLREASQNDATRRWMSYLLRTGERNSILVVINEHPKIKRRALRAAEAVLGRHVHPRRNRPRPTGRDSAVHAIDPGPLSNKLLAALPHKDIQLLIPHLISVQLAQGLVLHEPGVEVDQVYFPLSGMISMVVVMRDGKAIETATVGREGVVGAMSGLGLPVSQVRAIAQLPMFASRIASTEMRKAVAASKPIADLCLSLQ